MGQTQRGETPLEREAVAFPATSEAKSVRTKRSWFRLQFGLRSLLVFTLVAGAAGGLLSLRIRRAKRQREIVRHLLNSRCTMQYDNGLDPATFKAIRPAGMSHFWDDVDFWHGVVTLQSEPRNYSFSPKDLEHIAALPDLEQLSIDFPRRVSAFPFPRLACRGQLKQLSLGGQRLSSDAVERVSECEALTHLQIAVDDRGCAEVGRFDRLRQLRMLRIDGPILDKAAAQWQHITGLETLVLPDLSHVSSKSLAAFLRCNPKLVRVHLNHAECTVEVCEALAQCHSLGELSLAHSTIDDEALSKLGRLSNLSVLWIAGAQVRGTGFAGKGVFPQLQQLLAEKSSIDDEGAIHLGNLPRLHTADLSQTKITDAATGPLTQGNLATLDLSRNTLSDRGMEDFSGKQLHELNVKGTKVSPRAFAVPSRWPKLTILQLSEPARSESELEDVLRISTLRTFRANGPASQEFLFRHRSRFTLSPPESVVSSTTSLPAGGSPVP